MRLEEVLNQLSEPDVAADAAKFQKLMKEQAELQPVSYTHLWKSSIWIKKRVEKGRKTAQNRMNYRN